MEINIVKAARQNMADCVEALECSLLGKYYFSAEGSAGHILEEGFEKGEIYIAQDSAGNFLGFLWYIKNAMFHSFPFLHIIAVKQQYRGMGVGRQMLQFFEEQCFSSNSKVFLVVADFNPQARKFYEQMGYKKLGEIPGLYRESITETLMMKRRPET